MRLIFGSARVSGRREITPTRNLLDFAVFVAYFPHLVAGPILRASRLLPQIATPRTVSREQMCDGLWLIAWGFFQKIFVADNLASLVNMVFDPAAKPTGVNVLLGAYGFAFQIYGDFAGYSNIARGTSKLMGIELIENFRFPYFVRTPQEFWRHWHISLSTWLRDYLYIPLGGNRGSAARTNCNLLITMVLGGLWHGAAWTFVLWGAVHGAYLAINHLWRGAGLRLPRFLGWPLTLNQVRVLAPGSPSASQKPAIGIRQRCSGLGATKRHMKLARSAILLTGLGLAVGDIVLSRSGKPQTAGRPL